MKQFIREVSCVLRLLLRLILDLARQQGLWFRTRGNGHKLKNGKFSLNIKETLCHYEGDQAVPQIAQGGCGVSIVGDTQNSSGHGLGHPALGGSIWAGGLDQMTSRGPFQPQPFCDSLLLWTLFQFIALIFFMSSSQLQELETSFG